jgi:hypothetical protein
MDQFEKQFEDLDVHTSVLETAMGTATTTSTPASQVDDLIKQVHTYQMAAPTYCLGWLIGPSVETVRCDVLFTPA